MRHIYEYLPTKVVKPLKDNFFPEELDKDKIIEFLEENGFKKTTFKISIDNFYRELRTSKTPLYVLGDGRSDQPLSYWIRFGINGRISKTNPVFFCRYKDPCLSMGNDYYNFSEDNGESRREVIEYSTFEKFRERVGEVLFQ